MEDIHVIETAVKKFNYEDLLNQPLVLKQDVINALQDAEGDFVDTDEQIRVYRKETVEEKKSRKLKENKYAKERVMANLSYVLAGNKFTDEEKLKLRELIG